MSKYKVKIKDGDKEVDEEVEIDTEKQTETVNVPKTDSGNAGEVKVVFDFKKVNKFLKVICNYVEGSGECDCITASVVRI